MSTKKNTSMILDSPCKMYFDLEYSKIENPCLNDKIILENFLRVCISS